MSLQIWLPLQGDLHNQGLNYNLITNNVVFNNNGKLGSCLESTSLLDLNIPQTIYDVYTVNDTEISYCLWVKIDKTFLNTLISTTDFSTKTQIYNKIMGFNSGTTSNGIGLHVRTDSGLTQSSVLDSLKLYAYLRNGTAAQGTVAVDMNLDQWYHLCVTYDKSNIFKFYINGALTYSNTIARAALNTNISDQKVVLNSKTCQLTSSGSQNVHLLNLKEYINDVRIYDHALSPKEVEEIAKGLVLHYKLDNNGMGGENLAADTSTMKTLAPTGTATYCSPTGFYRQTTDGLAILHNATTNDIFTVSFDYVVTGADTSFNIAPTLNRTSSAYSSPTWISRQNATIPIGNSSGHFIGIMSPTAEQITYGNGWLIVVGANNRNISILISNFKFEQGSKATTWSPAPSDTEYPALYKTTVYDSSGYSHNGTITGSLTAAAGSPRYDVATVFDATNGRFDFDHFTDTDTLTNEFTFSGWIYRNYTDATTRYIYYGLCEIYLYTDFKPRITWNHASADLSYNTQNSWASGVVIPLQEWTHLVFTFKDGVLYYYINGVQYGPSDRSGTGTFMRGTRGTSNGHIGWSWIGNLSDIRTYATALTEDQVKELYNTSMSVDSNGNIHARELVEL